MNLFIDANIFLLFYQFSKDDLEELDKLRVLLRKKELTLWLPDQVREELRRKRENVIAAALKDLREQRLSCQFPAMSRDYDEHDILRKLQGEYGKHHAQLVERITQDAAAKSLKADSTIRSLIDLAKPIQISDEIYHRAKQRHDRGNPPGKPGSLGDAINWESLLQDVPPEEDFYIITDDKDFASVLFTDHFNPFLHHEWAKHKSSKLFYYKSLSAFFRERHPDIHFAPDLGYRPDCCKNML
jgi:PIN domain